MDLGPNFTSKMEDMELLEVLDTAVLHPVYSSSFFSPITAE